MEQLGVGRKGDVLLLHSGVNVDLAKVAFLQMPAPLSSDQSLLQQELHPFCPDPFAPAHQTAGVERKMVLKMFKAAEVLPVGIFQPAFDDGFIAEVEHAAEVSQPDHQADRQTRATEVGRVQ